MQKTITPADAIVKDFNDIIHTLNGMYNLKGQQRINPIASSKTPSHCHEPHIAYEDYCNALSKGCIL